MSSLEKGISNTTKKKKRKKEISTKPKQKSRTAFADRGSRWSTVEHSVL
jgi:hypothetical protein